MRRKTTFELDDSDEEFLLPRPTKNEDFDTMLTMKLCLFSVFCFLVFCGLARWSKEVNGFDDNGEGLDSKFVNSSGVEGSRHNISGSFVSLPP